MLKHQSLGGVVFLVSAVFVSAAEMGRESAVPQPVSSSSIEVRRNYAGPVTEGRLGLEPGFDWNLTHWNVGDGHNDQGMAPDLAVFFGINDIFDIRLTGRYLSLKENEDKLDIWRFGLGSRAWIPVTKDFLPYAGLALNYYTFSGIEGGRSLDNTRGAIGLSVEAGAAYLINEWVSIRAGIQGEVVVINGKADVGTEGEDVSLQGIGLNVGLAMNF